MRLFNFLQKKAHTLDARITSSEEEWYGLDAEVDMEKLINYYKTDVLFHMVVQTNVAHSVGQGFYTSVDTDNPKAIKNQEIIDEFIDEIDLDTKNQLIARDVWATGNCFIDPLTESEMKITGFEIVPVSTIVQIARDEMGKVLWYRQNTTDGYEKIPAEKIIHFKWQPVDNSAWGEGVGQILARKGMGYKLANGKIAKKPSQFELNELHIDTVARMYLAGQPRWLISSPNTDKKDLRGLANQVNNMKPNQHLLVNDDIKVETIGLGTQGKFDDAHDKIQEQGTLATNSPIPFLWTDQSFSYASSESALNSAQPQIDMYQRAHARFIEQFIFRRVLEQNNRDWHKGKVKLNWGKKQSLDFEHLKDVFEIFEKPMMQGTIDIDDIFRLLQEAGIDVNRKRPETKPMKENLQALAELSNKKEKKIPVRDLPIQTQNEIKKAQILDKLLKKV